MATADEGRSSVRPGLSSRKKRSSAGRATSSSEGSWDRSSKRHSFAERDAARARLEPIASFFNQVLQADAFFVLTSAAFDFSSPFVPANVHYTGPILDDPQWADPWSAPWPSENSDPLVLVGSNQSPHRRRSPVRLPGCSRTIAFARMHAG